MYSKTKIMKSIGNCSPQTKRLTEELYRADAVVIGAGAGLSASAGFVYSGERFQKYFSDFILKYGFQDMYSAGFYPFATPEEYWAYWSRYIYINRYQKAPHTVYDDLLSLLKGKDYFVLTTNVDHCFQKAGFDKRRLFYTQGDYGLWQCSVPCHSKTYDNAAVVRRMIEAQGFAVDAAGDMYLPEAVTALMTVPDDLVPYCPKCGNPMSMNLRADSSFAEDEGWRQAAARYDDFLRHRRDGRTLFWELGTGFNTPGIIKYSFWQMTAQRPGAVYACINLGEAWAPEEIADKSICINEDIGKILKQILSDDIGI